MELSIEDVPERSQSPPTEAETESDSDSNEPRSRSLYELEGCLDLMVLSYLCTVPELPPNPLTLDMTRKSWGVREHALSQDGKMTRNAQLVSATLSLVCKRWHTYIRKPKVSAANLRAL